MDVGEWLKGIGLGRYEATFREHEIDAEVLPELTEADLEKFGVPFGHRKRLIRAIAKLGNAPPEQPAAPSPPSRTFRPDAERRPITVMFCDLVGSTGLAARLDPEDWRNLVNAYLDAASAAVTGLGGHVLKRLGDGLMALFGYPRAQENDGERALRAALAIQSALAELNARNAEKGAPALAARIGLDSGPVVVEATGEVFGDAPNIAARVQGAADPGAVLATMNVQRQAAGLFVAEDKGAHELKGVSEPVRLFRIVRASGAVRRSGARVLTPFVGREEELSVIGRRWERARAGDGQLVMIVGEPGLGKSRLIEEFRARLTETPHTWVEWSASQLLQNTPLHPVAEWGRQRFGGPDIAAEKRLAELESALQQVRIDADEAAPLLAPLLDIPLPRSREATLAPEEMRRRQLTAIVSWILAGARTQAIVLAFEDLQWADPTSIDLMRALAERGTQAPLLLIATSRPEFRPPWGLRSHHGVISLAPLDRAQAVQMVGELASRHALSKEVIEGVSDRTGGVPLFLEEVTRLLLERGAQGGAQAIPLTLQQSLAARLDRLGEAREAAQIGAALGREFAYPLLRDVAEMDEPALQAALERLAEADILFVEGAGHEASYRFKHALIQDAAYDSLLKSRRQALHRRAAEILRDDPERAAASPELIAHHFTQAGLDDLAIEWWGKAGDQALRRSAFQEAIAHLGKAIAMADKAGAAGASGERRHLHVVYGNALIAARGYGAPETTEAFARARALAYGDTDTDRLAADFGLWVGNYVRGELSAMRAHAETFLGDVDANPDSPEAGVAHRVAGTTHWCAGEYAAARGRLEHALALFQSGRDDDLAFRFGQDVGVSAMLWLALTLWPLGDIGRAVSLVGDAEMRIAGLAHVGTRAFWIFHAAMFELTRGNLARATAHAVELARLSREHDLSLWRAFGAFLEGLTFAQSSTAGNGLEAMRRGIELLREQNVLAFDGLFKIALAEAEAEAGDVDRAVVVLDEALATCERTGHRSFEPQLHRARGEILVKRDPSNLAPAEEAYKTAIAIAKQQGARTFELRAALALAKLYQSTGRPADAHAVLAPALDGFAPTPEMPEIAKAQALLTALAETDEVKATAAQRQRRLKLQTAYGYAVMWSKGFAAEETKAAFARVGDFAVSAENRSARFAAYDGQCLTSALRGDLSSARQTAELFLREAEAEGSGLEAEVARSRLGFALLNQGDLIAARSVFERVLVNTIPERDGETRFRFGRDTEVSATSCLAFLEWHLGEPERARQLINRAFRRADELGSIPATVVALYWKVRFECHRHDAAAARHAADALLALTEEHGIRTYADLGWIYANWASGRLLDPEAGAVGLKQWLDTYTTQGNKLSVPYFYGLLAELKANTRGPEYALTLIDRGLAIAGETGEHLFDPYLYRLRGDILLRPSDPANPASAEQAFKTAIALAKEQGARTYKLLASLSLAKLYQSTDRTADAYAVLAPALEGFSPTPEMPEIAEAQALRERLA